MTTAENHKDWSREKTVAHALDRVVGIDLNDYACALARTGARHVDHLALGLGRRDPELAANGIEAVDALRRQPYDIILMDVQMPEMDGMEASRRINVLLPDRRERPWIIALTANAMQGDREACFAAGMDDYLSKPFKTEDLAAALTRARQHAART